MTKLQELKIKIIKLNLNSINEEILKTGDYNDNFNLEDVLMVLKKKGFNPADYIVYCQRLINGEWQLGKPIHEQDEKTINFLHNILC